MLLLFYDAKHRRKAQLNSYDPRGRTFSNDPEGQGIRKNFGHGSLLKAVTPFGPSNSVRFLSKNLKLPKDPFIAYPISLLAAKNQ